MLAFNFISSSIPVLTERKCEEGEFIWTQIVQLLFTPPIQILGENELQIKIFFGIEMEAANVSIDRFFLRRDYAISFLTRKTLHYYVVVGSSQVITLYQFSRYIQD